VALDDLLEEPFVLRERGSGTRQVAEVHLRAAGVELERVRVVAELAGSDAIKAAVAAGLGVSIISRSALPDGAAAAGLLVRRIEGLRLTRQMAAATLRGTPPLPATRRLLAALRPELARASSL
jgi:DNA-binding transcriptional LysR family regulator